MRRRIMIIMLLLVIGGAIVNVAVAWGSVYHAIGSHPLLTFEQRVHYVSLGEPLSTVSFRFGTVTTWRTSQAISVTWGPGTTFLSMSDFDDRLPWWSALKGSTSSNEASRAYGNHEHVGQLGEAGAGWPIVALRGARMSYGFGAPETIVGQIELPVRDRRGYGRVRVPIQPIWPGFAINTMFYAAVLWVVFFAPGTIKRAIRRRRGLCPACAYPVGTSPVCTECGAAIFNRHVNSN